VSLKTFLVLLSATGAALAVWAVAGVAVLPMVASSVVVGGVVWKCLDGLLPD